MYLFIPLRAQSSGITLNYSNTPIREVMDGIEEQSGLVFSYNTKLLKGLEDLTVHIDRVELDSALEVVFLPYQIRYIRMEKQLVLKKDRRIRITETKTNASIPKLISYTISGYARDVATGEVLIGATVAVPDGSTGSITNSYGFYSLTLEDPADSLICSYVGYGRQARKLNGYSEVIEFQLKEHLQSIVEVVVYSDERLDEVRTARSSEIKVRTESVRKMPALFGEKDVIKSLAAIPGIKFFGDGSTIFYVRGGSRDQNLVTIDEAPLYNPAHMMGFFSTIVPDAVKDIQVYKGDFPAKYGGRLSSLVDIRTKDGNMQQFGMDASFGLLSSRISMEGPVWKDRISYFISGRRSYFLKTLQRANVNLEDLHFGDLHFKINYQVNQKNRVFFSIYNSVDNFEAGDGSGTISGINWQNSTYTMRWNHLITDRLFSNFTLYASRYDYFLNTSVRNGNYWNSHIDNISLKTDFTWYVSPVNTFRFGALISQHFMNPGNYYVNNQLLTLPYEISTKSANENSLYISDQVVLRHNLSIRLGLRLTAWNNIGPAVEYRYSEGQLNTYNISAGQIYHTSSTADPRLGVIYKTGHDNLLKFSYARTSQFEHLITNSISPFSTLEVWLPSGPNIKPQRADQVTFGYQHQLGSSGVIFESEVYYKAMHNLIDYRDHAKLLMNPFMEAQLLFGEGRSYGLESMISKKAGRLTGWISYTLSKSWQLVPGINNENPYPSYGDRPHDISIFLSYKLSDRLELTGNFIYMTGSPFTAPTAFYYRDNIQVPVYFKRNNDRLPDYHRLDVALNWDLRKKEGRFDHELIFSIYNLYGRKNPVAIHFNKIEDDNGNLTIPYDYYSAPELVASQFYIYQFVPSVSYHFKF